MAAGVELAEAGLIAEVGGVLQRLERISPQIHEVEKVVDDVQATSTQIAELRSRLRPQATAHMEARLLQVLGGFCRTVAEGAPSAPSPAEPLSTVQALMRAARELPAATAGSLMQDLVEQEAALVKVVRESSLSEVLSRGAESFTSSFVADLAEALKAFASTPLPRDTSEQLEATLEAAVEFAETA